MMKMKRIFSLVLAATLLSGLCACGGSSAMSGTATPEPTAPTEPAPAETATLSPTETPTAEPSEIVITPEPTPTPINIDIPWTDVTYSVKDNNGYTFDITLHLSPWILLSDTDLINSAWDKVSGGKMLPQFNDWGFTRSGNAYQCTYLDYSQHYGAAPTLSWYMTDMYYSVGTVTIRNTTSGFDITPSDPRSVIFQWGCNMPPQNSGGYIQRSAGRILYSNDVATRINGFYISASVSSNVWGPVPVVLMTSEYISPNTPDGLAKDILSNDFVFCGISWVSLESENTQVHLGILKGDGEYIAE